MADGEALTLSARMNKASKKIHNLSNSFVNAKLVALLTDRELYAKALSRFYVVFTALESALDKALKQGDPDVGKFKTLFCDASMYRAAAFRTDLEHLLGPDWETRCGPRSVPLQEYEHHLSLLASDQPRLLLAHCYTQHLGITAGGQIVRRAVRKHLALPEGCGTAAFEFKGETSSAIKAHFKSTFDEWGRGLSEEDVQQLVSEHLTAFQFNNAIIRAFPIPAAAVAKGVLRVAPRPLLAAALALLVLLVALTVPWVAATLRSSRS
ncbi:hypothetical protein PLESTB_000576300 [Pleodorina starrii]|uniref:Heme oxygenase n=1 Tax=Pleodorina starrii TaxID=330485 RepID=A0A9W6BHB3_9CHLO|nr:hypothetical protein PLESTM_000308600 [Pleodorina starrii]GLC52044.1 hypothetical protein PLESTB_000576300 [Pleodorina starrii]GLC72185.1 hypothetical protein PLESTF_001216200 [Pleodorina starrii]